MRQINIVKLRGFTLIEVMIVVAIIAILASVAVPSYLESVRRGDRAAAAATLMKNAAWMQQQFTVNNKYPATGTALPFAQSPESGTAKYAITLAAGTGSADTTYSLLATKASAADKCGNFALDETGKRSISISTDVALTADCWGGR